MLETRSFESEPQFSSEPLVSAECEIVMDLHPANSHLHTTTLYKRRRKTRLRRQNCTLFTRETEMETEKISRSSQIVSCAACSSDCCDVLSVDCYCACCLRLKFEESQIKKRRFRMDSKSREVEQNDQCKKSLKIRRRRRKLRSALILISNVLILFPILFLMDINSCDRASLMLLEAAQLTPDKEQRIRTKPDELITITEGDTYVLPCEVDNQQGNAQWLKNGFPVYHRNRTKLGWGPEYERLFMVGDASKGEQNLELRAAQLEDSGRYECQVMPATNEGTPLRVYTNVTVYPPLTTTAATPTPPESAPDGELARPLINKGSQLQARDILSLAKLGQTTTTNQSSAGPANSNLLPFITPHASTAHGPTPSNMHVALLSWPYLLLLLAAILMLANIYLIMSLVKRHKRRSKSAGFSQQDNSLESDSNGGSSATSSAGTATSRLGTNEMSQCELEPNSIEIAPEMMGKLESSTMQLNESCHMMSQSQSLNGSNTMNQHLSQSAQCAAAYPISHRICAVAPHLQQVWNGHEFVAIDSNGWVLEI